MRNSTITPTEPAQAFALHANLDAVHSDLIQLEEEYSTYLEQESVKSDVQCLRSWIEAYLKGDVEAADYLHEHGIQLLDNVKTKLQSAAREIQRIDEESPGGSNFSGGKADRLTKAAQTALDAEDKLCQALDQEMSTAESRVVTK